MLTKVSPSRPKSALDSGGKGFHQQRNRLFKPDNRLLVIFIADGVNRSQAEVKPAQDISRW